MYNAIHRYMTCTCCMHSCMALVWVIEGIIVMIVFDNIAAYCSGNTFILQTSSVLLVVEKFYLVTKPKQANLGLRKLFPLLQCRFTD